MVTLVILDGFGISKNEKGNAIKSQGTPFLDKLKKKYPHSILKASGEAVGLPKGQVGNSEVGHLTIGAGRVVLQDLLKINRDIENGEFGKNKNLIRALKYAKNGRLHVLGLLSDGGVHSHINHLYAILREAEKYEIKEIFIHAILDGRDVPVSSGLKFLEELNSALKENMFISSVCGRVFAMDREERYDRIKKAYDMLTTDIKKDKSFKEVVSQSYKNAIYDEFLEPVLLKKNGNIQDGDSVIFYNFRSDRAREITSAFTSKNFDKFKTKKFKNLLFSPMEEYSDEFKELNTIYPPEIINPTLASIISKKGLKQFHIAETTKYAHVTFFINGGREKAFKGEERKLIESIDTQNFEYYPQMRASEITEETFEAIASEKYDFVLVNLSNLDMIGHTGNFNATKEAVKIVDKCAYAIALATLMAGGDCIITADHGNAESMFDKMGNKITSHTNNPVPFILVTKRAKKVKEGSLANVAPTVLKLLDLEIPDNMERPLF